jgi:CxxC motif-containing protein (DUF1111 family)
VTGRGWHPAARWSVAVLWSAGLGVLSAVPAAQTREPVQAGGATTVDDASDTAFGRALGNLDPLRWNEFLAGRRRFLGEWPARGRWADAVSCADCHFRDGRGPGSADGSRSHLLRLARDTPGGDPVYGIQLLRTGYQVPAPGQFSVRWEEIRGRYPSGDPYVLRRPRVTISDLAYGPLDPETRFSLRVPPSVFGLGLLEAIPEPQILASADEGDRDNDGVSGRAQLASDPATGSARIGRFGWRASQPSLAAQTSAALSTDLGVASPGDTELTLLVRYLRALAVPSRRRSTEAIVRDGEALFASSGCAACHRERFTTGALPGWPELANQVITPYTDLLLHDMGEGLADTIGEGVASGREWRTPPLWGLGLLQTVSGSPGLMHDGRALSAEEAILWHGGEADRARRRFMDLSPEKRNAVIQFLSSL